MPSFPNFNAASKLVGLLRSRRHMAMYALQPSGGDYGTTDSDINSANGNAIAYADATITVDPVSGKPVLNYMQVPTYMAAAFGIGLTNNGCVAQLKGAANIKARLCQVVVSGHFTAVTPVDLVIYKCSTAVSGGTTATETSGNFDSADAAASCTPTIYSTAGTLGTIIDIVAAQHRIFGSTTGIGEGPGIFQWPQGGEMPTLNSASEYFAICVLNAASDSGASLSVNLEWSENSY